MKKQILTALLAGALLANGSAVMAKTDVTVTVDEKNVTFADVGAELIDGVTYIPVRGVLENMGADVEWDGASQSVIINYNNIGIDFTIGSDKVTVTNGTDKKTVTLENTALIKNDRTLVPLRFAAETAGCDVEWDENTSTAKIFTKKYKALELINSFANGDTSVAENVLTENYIQHNLAYETGRNAFIGSVEYLAAAEVKTTVNNVRAFEDGDYVFLQTVYNFAGAGEQVAFDIFRFENGKIAEHWDNLAAVAEPNPSGHTQIDGTLEIKDINKTEENRELVNNFLYDVMQGNNADKTADYFEGDTYIQHNTSIADGVSGLGAALAEMAEQNIAMVYDKTHLVLAQGNFVLAVSEGTFGGVPTSYYDLWRVENGKIAEHWDVMETIADKSTWANENGKF